MRLLKPTANVVVALFVSCALVFSNVSTVKAVDDKGLLSDENSRISNGIFYYNPKDTCGETTTPTIVAPITDTGPNAEAILRFFVGKGITLAAAAGFAGNMKQESGLNPKIIQGGAIAPDNYIPKSGVGFGLVQWTSSGRQKGLVAFAKARSEPITSLNLQLEYTWQELNTGYKTSTLNKVAAMTNPVDAAIIIHDNYEISADSDSTVRSVRGGNAKTYYDQYKGKITESTTILATDTAETATIADTGGEGVCNVPAADLTGGVGEANGLTFPLKTTQAVLKKGINGSVWCFSNESNCHHDYNAADIFVPTGTPIIAAKPGKVVSKTTDSCVYSGCNVSVKGDDGLLYYYTHMDKKAIVNVGQEVQSGQQLGSVGTDATAMNTPRHLHFDITRGSFRPSCSGASCKDSDFINVQNVLIPAFNNLPSGGATENV